MKQIKSFEHASGWGSVDYTTKKVNEFIATLNEKGIDNVEIDITSTGRGGVMYTVIYDNNDLEV